MLVLLWFDDHNWTYVLSMRQSTTVRVQHAHTHQNCRPCLADADMAVAYIMQASAADVPV